MNDCELDGCKSKGPAKESIGRFQVYDGEQPTMSRPARLCQACHDFAIKCGLTPKKE